MPLLFLGFSNWNFDKWFLNAHFVSFWFNGPYCATGLRLLHPWLSKYKFYSIILFISLFSKRVDLWQFLNRNGRPWANGGQFFPIFCNTKIGNGSDLPCLLLTIVYLIRVSIRINKNLSFYLVETSTMEDDNSFWLLAKN